jgi:two-component system NtrC family sensor kinase
MLSHWSIRNKLLFCIVTLFLIVAVLASSSFRGVYAYRELARSISYQRANELMLASELSFRVAELRSTVGQARSRPPGNMLVIDGQGLREEFRLSLWDAYAQLERYEEQLRSSEQDTVIAGDGATRRPEWYTVVDIRQALDDVSKLSEEADWIMNEVLVSDLDEALRDLQKATLLLPAHQHERMSQFANDVRGQYRTWIVLVWICSLLSVGMLGLLVQFFVSSVFRPLRCLIQGSRRIARERDFNHRIQLRTNDEVAELAEAMNAMTDQFQKIRADLDRQIQERDEQVKQRTKEVVCSEKLASVGLLAAGVAHEINNPMAAIAWAAEALEMRVHDIIQEDERQADEEQSEEIAILKNYLQDIQNEAFRCKGITDRLLDFSRLGDMEKQNTDLRELVQGVIDMVRHLGKYREKRIEFTCADPPIVAVNAQEIKQVVLNLITNALDSLDVGGTVKVDLSPQGDWAELVVRDNGCGMTEEVTRHLFEPFFTRRRDGQGTGLGLSISYRIVEDHGGKIVAFSDGPGCGSEFRVTFPLNAANEQERQEKRLAA